MAKNRWTIHTFTIKIIGIIIVGVDPVKTGLDVKKYGLSLQQYNLEAEDGNSADIFTQKYTFFFL